MKRTTEGWLVAVPFGIIIAVIVGLIMIARIDANHAAAVHKVADPVTNLVGGFVNVILFGFLTIVCGFGAGYAVYDIVTKNRR